MLPARLGRVLPLPALRSASKLFFLRRVRAYYVGTKTCARRSYAYYSSMGQCVHNKTQHFRASLLKQCQWRCTRSRPLSVISTVLAEHGHARCTRTS